MMKILKLLNTILISVVITISVYLSIFDIINNNVYEILIKLFVIPVILLPKILRKNGFKIYLSEEIIYTLFIFVSYFLGSIIDLYNKIYFYDTLMHFLSGILTSFLALDILKRENIIDKNKMYINVLFVLGITFMIAGLWEIFEFTTDNIFGKDAQKVLTTGVTDTMKDIISAFLGSLIIIISYIYEKVNKTKLFIINFIKSIG